MSKYHTYILCLFVFINLQAQNNSFDNTLDSIQRLRKLTKNDNIKLDTRLRYAKQARDLSYETKIDSTILLSNERIVHVYLLKNEYELAIKLGQENLKLAQKVNDSLAYAFGCCYLGYGYILSGIYKDSSYFYYNKALKISKKLNHTDLTISTLLNLANIQDDHRDYLSSEINLIEAASFLQTLPKDQFAFDKLSNVYNQIGLTLSHQKLYKKAIDYFNKALEINNKLPNEYNYEDNSNINKYENYLYSKINLAEVYKKKKDYKNALSIYNELLENKDLIKKDLLSYVAIINNKAYVLFLAKRNKTKLIKSLFNKAYKISNSLNALYEIASGGNDMAEFYYAINKKDSAHILSKRSYTVGKQIKNYHELSRALLMLSKIEKGEAGKKYLYEHIKLNDSLINVERTSRNKFARIQYETDTYIEETKRLTSQNILITIIGLIIILVFALILIIRVQITKNKVLRFEGEQQKANEEIYTLMLRQQAKIEEGRLMERHHISEELHDGILNKLLGSRLGLEFLVIDQKNKGKFNVYIDEIRTIEKEIRDLSHELKNTKLDAEKDFITILKNYVDYQSNLHVFQYNFNHTPNIAWENINDHVKVNLYRIIQEAIQNIVKHAKATTITINFSLNHGELQLDIIDDGTGFNSNKQSKGIGLLNIKSRVSKLKGKLKISSETKKGTSLIIKLPVNQK
ncbi:ATP-binding protein [Flavivirga eckloniae]|uniref:histidine kinase n=1 Tax=Flavivirga eckloniae TaxID=1803846 RepID=A0A2K9PL61_9FLAO|nr:sensor histidine kinase [Flavivirga eckloniae]AUP77804.1 hypothetical protein C1H87_03365 [Flavivirga eckloniae]